MIDAAREFQRLLLSSALSPRAINGLRRYKKHRPALVRTPSHRLQLIKRQRRLKVLRTTCSSGGRLFEGGCAWSESALGK
jgi:hypothetical protein